MDDRAHKIVVGLEVELQEYFGDDHGHEEVVDLGFRDKVFELTFSIARFKAWSICW